MLFPAQNRAGKESPPILPLPRLRRVRTVVPGLPLPHPAPPGGGEGHGRPAHGGPSAQEDSSCGSSGRPWLHHRASRRPAPPRASSSPAAPGVGEGRALRLALPRGMHAHSSERARPTGHAARHSLQLWRFARFPRQPCRDPPGISPRTPSDLCSGLTHSRPALDGSEVLSSSMLRVVPASEAGKTADASTLGNRVLLQPVKLWTPLRRNSISNDATHRRSRPPPARAALRRVVRLGRRTSDTGCPAPAATPQFVHDCVGHTARQSRQACEHMPAPPLISPTPEHCKQCTTNK